MDLIKALNEKQLQNDVPQVEVGDTVRVHVKVKEGARERVQVFEGTVIAKKHGLHRPSYLLRRGRGEGVPRSLSLYREGGDCAPRLCPSCQALLPA